VADESTPRHLPFTVDARIIAQLGEQLVPSDLMALAELVKNSYDADASIVSIDYTEESGEPEIIVEDDGNGMTFDRLREGWMHIGTAEKEREPSSPRYGRPRAGIKGVGRFAAQRLGDRLQLSTTPRGSGTTYCIDFDWTRFSAGRPLDSIIHDVREAAAGVGAQGTRLSITGLHRSWTMDDLTEVIKDLSRIHAPSDAPNRMRGNFEPDPGFEVVAAFHGDHGVRLVDELDLLREERVMHLHGEVDTSGQGVYELEFFRPGREPKRVAYKQKLSTGPLSFDVDLALFSTPWVQDLGLRRAQAIGRKHGGVRIWRDGFRVFPYGEPHDDWLGIDEHIAARRQPLNLWRNQGILGGVRISRDLNPGLQDLLTRRGMVETQAFKDLRTFLFEGLVIAANEHAALTTRKTRSGPRKLKPSEALQSVLDMASGETEAPASSEPTALEQGERAAERAGVPRSKVSPEFAEQLVSEVRHAESEIVSENQMLKVLASLGTGIAVFAHEMKTVSLDVAVSATELDRLAGDLPIALGPRLQAEAVRLRSGIESLSTYTRYVEDFVSDEARTRRRSMELSEFLEDFFSVFQPLLDRRNISCHVTVPRGLWLCPLFKAELISIYFNLMTNAVKALLAPGVTERKLGVFGARHGDEIVTVFADTGCGIPADIVQEVFDPFVTRSHVPGDASLGRGTGLGLYIVREIVIGYDGEVTISEPPEGYTTGVQVRLPARRTP
jgi:signal transduction histidine kinase/anti-sigma regulatory factor (Ser/Thr protein kinase)